jgi:predicted unusual protein kinase regulating ubiquinone biosynthesis (AarF/ABC1/UbiB family)
MQIGPMLQDVTTISVRHNVRLPASLALTAKAFSQMQLAAAELDPTLDPLSVAGSFVFKYTVRQLLGGLDPKHLLVESRKARLRISRMFEAVERVTGAKPGASLQVNFRGTERLEASVTKAARRLAIALATSGAIVGTAMTITSPRVAKWVPTAMGGLGSVLAAGLLADLARRRD